MIKSLIIFPFIFLFYSCENRQSSPVQFVVLDTLPAILIFGLGDNTMENIRNSVAKKYGFRFRRVGGCVVSRALRDTMKIHNEALYKKLEELHGKDFRSKLYEKINLISTLQYRVEYILNNDSGIVRKNKELGKEPYAMYYEIDPEIQNSIMQVHAYDWADVEGCFRKRTYYTVYIDTLKDSRFR